MDEKSNEIPAVRELLKAFADLAGAVLTIDAMHTQTDTAKAILARRADYVMTVKANMPTLYKQLRKLPWTRIPSASSVSRDHGRQARRTIKVALAPAWTGFDGAARVAQQEERRGRLPGHQRPQREPGDPDRLGRRHWHIENKLHWVRIYLPGGQNRWPGWETHPA